MGGGASKIYQIGKDEKEEKEEEDFEQNSEEDEDDDKTIWENGLLDLGSKTLGEDELECSMSDTETMVGRRPRGRKRSSTWSYPSRPPPRARTVKRSFMCCTGNSVAFQVAVNFKPHISDLADVGGDDD